MAGGSGSHDLVGVKAMKDEGLIFCILKCLSLKEARRLWNLQRLFYKVLDGKVIPLLALYEHDWSLVSHYMNFPADGFLEGHPRFEYNYDNICVEAIQHHDFEGLQLLARRHYDFHRVQRDPRLLRFAREALVHGRLEQLFVLRSVSFDISEVLAECAAKQELSEILFMARSVIIEFLGQRLHYCCSALDFVRTDYVERSISHNCTSRENLFKIPFIMAAFIRAGASPCCLLRPDGCGYLLLLAIASESFNFVYLLIKEAIHLEAVFQMYRLQFQRMVLKALEHQRLSVLELLRFCGYQLGSDEDVLRQFDAPVLKCLLEEDFAPIERLCRLGFSVRQFAERNQADFYAFVQSRLEESRPQLERWTARASASVDPGTQRLGVHPAIQRLAVLDRRALELHFRSPTFLQFVETLLAKKSFVILRQIVEVHQHAFDAYFMEHYAPLEAVLVDAFMLRDTSLIVDLASLCFPVGLFFKRKEAEIDTVLLNTWFPNKCWTDLGMLKSEVRQWSYPAFFNRNRGRSDDFVVSIIENGYWFDLHNLAQLSFDFASFFDRRFDAVSTAVVNFITMPHFVLLRELSALNFPWGRFMQAHRKKIPPSKDHDFLRFVISLEGFELGSKVYDVVEQTCQLYHSMAASKFKVHYSAAEVSLGTSTSEVSGGSASFGVGELLESPASASSSSTALPHRQEASAGTEADAASEVAASSACRGGTASAGAADACSSGSSSETGMATGSCSGGSSSSSGGGGGGGSSSSSSSVGAAGRSRDGVQPDSAVESGGGDSAARCASGAPPLERQRLGRGGSVGQKLRGARLSATLDQRTASQGDRGVSEAARVLRTRAKDLVRKAREKKLDLRKVWMLTVCKGSYCWNPLKVDLEDPEDGKELPAWQEIESVLNFLESQDDVVAQASSMSSHILPHHVQALAAGVPGGVGIPGGAMGATGVVGVMSSGAVHGAVAAVHHVQHLGLPAPPPLASLSMPPALHLATGGTNGLHTHQHIPAGLLVRTVCLAQRGEERAFTPKMELFWDGILDSALPLSPPL